MKGMIGLDVRTTLLLTDFLGIARSILTSPLATISKLVLQGAWARSETFRVSRWFNISKFLPSSILYTEQWTYSASFRIATSLRCSCRLDPTMISFSPTNDPAQNWKAHEEKHPDDAPTSSFPWHYAHRTVTLHKHNDHLIARKTNITSQPP